MFCIEGGKISGGWGLYFVVRVEQYQEDGDNTLY